MLLCFGGIEGFYLRYRCTGFLRCKPDDRNPSLPNMMMYRYKFPGKTVARIKPKQEEAKADENRGSGRAFERIIIPFATCHHDEHYHSTRVADRWRCRRP